MNSFAPALLTDQYELTMVSAALRDGTAGRNCVFEVFARRLPTGRRYGVVAGPGRLMELIIEIRATARKNKDFATADRIRGVLGELGIALEDRASGTGWTRGK